MKNIKNEESGFTLVELVVVRILATPTAY